MVILKILSLQLEESNKTLTKDVENLSKDKAELSDKLHTQEEGTVALLTFVTLVYCDYIVVQVEYLFFFFYRVYGSEGRDYKYNQGQLWEGPQHRAHTENSGNDGTL